jgi:aryl sulfotransferase
MNATGRQLVHYTDFIFDSSRWEGFELRPDDIIISTPPKSGTTWVQMITALLIFQTPELPAPLPELSPWFDILAHSRRDVVANLEAQTRRRFIKTHTPLPGLPLADGVTYICVGRDPRDAALSMDDHMANTNMAALPGALAEAAAIDGREPPAPPPPPPEDLDQSDQARMWRWILDDTPPTQTFGSLRAALAHVQSFWDLRHSGNVVMLHYEELKADLEGEMRALAARLGIDVPEERWPVLAAAASFEEMRSRASVLVPFVDKGAWLDNASFFKKGRTGAWREVLTTDDDLRRYDERVASLAPPELAAWIHRT